MRPGHDELLRPTLTAADDFVGFGRPFRPPSLALATFFGGAFCAAILFAWNWRELGLPREARLSAWLFGALGLFLPLAMLALVSQGLLAASDAPSSSGSERQLTRFALRAIPLIPAILVARAQGRRFRVFETSGGEPRPALGPALGAILVGFLISAGIIVLGGYALGIPASPR